MENFSRILRNINILYYVLLVLFVGVICFDIIPGFYDGFQQGFEGGVDIGKRIGELGTVDIIMKLLAIPMIVAFFWSIILLFKLIYHTGRSIARKDIFNPKCRRLINRYAIVAGSMFILMTIITLTQWSIGRYSREITDLIYDVLVQGVQIVILVILGQVLKIGEILKKEQNLTI